MRAPGERDQGDSVLRCRDIELAFGGLRALKGVSLEIPKGQIFGLVGPNGSGKTSMVNVITGFYRPQSGSVNLFGQEVVGLKPHRIAARGVARTFQNLALFRGMTVLENVLLGRHVFMGAEQAANVLADIKIRQLSRQGKSLSPAEINAIREPILDEYRRQQSAYYSTSHLWDDGILDPTDTRNALAMAISVALNAPIDRPHYGVFRM